ncbi:MAG TPA: 1,4-alpha-glucan branching protein GlgB, partial [Bryobacteraceae bacterium]|nr:1,4-alpha-glucan branching protein GlgB [Bryobacteraceae bacterium]
RLGAHLADQDGVGGAYFAVWAPNARRVSLIGDFNEWRDDVHPMQLQPETGVWDLFVPAISDGPLYKYRIFSRHEDRPADKADPYGFAVETGSQMASRVVRLEGYDWADAGWMTTRMERPAADAPLSIYELHLGSWMRWDDNRPLTYREIAHKLADYVHDLGYTHVELMPVAEHLSGESWGYQTLGYFAPAGRFGTPHDFMYLVDYLHQRGIGVILDWTAAHFPSGAHGLGSFDGTSLYELASAVDKFVFNYGRPEVRDFLIDNALFWFDRYHIDGLRLGSAASMLYLDYGRTDGEWIPNRFGGRENLDAIGFLRLLNERVHADYPDVMMIVEEATGWPMATRPTYLGGLGFDFRWNTGWMSGLLDYMSKDPIYRSYHHNCLAFGVSHAIEGNFILPFPHDEVVPGKGSMLGKMPGDDWQKFANLRLLYGFMFGTPGRKLMFMGGEFGDWAEWRPERSLDWKLLEFPLHFGLQRWVRDLNTFYRGQPAMRELDYNNAGFEWVDCSDSGRSVVSFIRGAKETGDGLLFVGNFTPVPRHNYRVGAPQGGFWRELLNSDAPLYGGSGQGNIGGVEANPLPIHGRPYSLNLTLPPLGILVFRPGGSGGAA